MTDLSGDIGLEVRMPTRFRWDEWGEDGNITFHYSTIEEYNEHHKMIYEYQCELCGHIFQVVTYERNCPLCGGKCKKISTKHGARK